MSDSRSACWSWGGHEEECCHLTLLTFLTLEADAQESGMSEVPEGDNAYGRKGERKQDWAGGASD